MGLFTKRTDSGRQRISRLRVFIGAVLLVITMSTAIMFSLGWFRSFEILLSSMEPTLLSGDRIIVDARPGFNPRAGDTVAVVNPRRGEEWFCKRIVAMPGDLVEFRRGRLYVNGQRRNVRGANEDEFHPLDIRMEINTAYGSLQLGENEYYVIGDNVTISYDSRYFGPVGRNELIGRVWFIYWPRSRWRTVVRAPYSADPPEQ